MTWTSQTLWHDTSCLNTILCSGINHPMPPSRAHNGGFVCGSVGTVIGSGPGAYMSLMPCGAACACGRFGGSELVGTVVSLCAAFVISVLGDDPWEVTGLTEFPELTSNIGTWFANSTSCVTPLLEIVLDRAKAELLTFSLFSDIPT